MKEIRDTLSMKYQFSYTILVKFMCAIEVVVPIMSFIVINTMDELEMRILLIDVFLSAVILYKSNKIILLSESVAISSFILVKRRFERFIELYNPVSISALLSPTFQSVKLELVIDK